MKLLKLTEITYDYQNKAETRKTKTIFLNLDHVICFKRVDYKGETCVFFETTFDRSSVTAKLYNPDALFLNGEINQDAFLDANAEEIVEHKPFQSLC